MCKCAAMRRGSALSLAALSLKLEMLSPLPPDFLGKGESFPSFRLRQTRALLFLPKKRHVCMRAPLKKMTQCQEKSQKRSGKHSMRGSIM